MIPATYQDVFIAYLMIWFGILTVLWGRELWRCKINDWALSEGRLCICEDCHFAFLIKPAETVSRCPRCDEVCMVRQRRR